MSSHRSADTAQFRTTVIGLVALMTVAALSVPAQASEVPPGADGPARPFENHPSVHLVVDPSVIDGELAVDENGLIEINGTVHHRAIDLSVVVLKTAATVDRAADVKGNAQPWSATLRPERLGPQEVMVGAARSNDRTASETFAISVVDLIPPTAPTQLRNGAGSPTTTAIQIEWNEATDNYGLQGYEVALNGEVVEIVSGTSYEFVNLQPDTVYDVTITALDLASNRSDSATITIRTLTDTTPPTPPMNIAVLPANLTSSSFAIEWGRSIDNLALAGYEVSLDDAVVETTVETSYTFSGLAPSTTYIASVVAFDTEGNRSNPTSIAVETASVDGGGGGGDDDDDCVTTPVTRTNRYRHFIVVDRSSPTTSPPPYTAACPRQLNGPVLAAGTPGRTKAWTNGVLAYFPVSRATRSDTVETRWIPEDNVEFVPLVLLDPAHGKLQVDGEFLFQRPETNGLIEDQLTLDISERVMDLYAADPDIWAVMDRLRKTDFAPYDPGDCDNAPSVCFVDIAGRVDEAERRGADIVLSIHTNGSDFFIAGRFRNGTEAYHFGGDGGELLAERIVDGIVDLGIANRGVKEEDYNIIDSTRYVGVLTEVAYHSNSTRIVRDCIPNTTVCVTFPVTSDSERLSDDAFLDDVAQVLNESIKDFVATEGTQ